MKRLGPEIRLEHGHARRLERLATRMGVSESEVIAAALSAYFSSESPDGAEAATARRLHQLAHQLEYVERDQTILIEMLALFIRDYLSAAPISEAHREAARAQGSARYEQFIEQLALRLQRGGNFVSEVEQESASDASTSLSRGEETIAGGTKATA